MIDHLSPKQVARALGVSEASVKRWCDKGVFDTAKTVGGHRRVSASSVLSYLRAKGKTPAQPQVLGLPELPTRRDSGLERAAPLLKKALEDADETSFRATTFALYLAGVDLAALFDKGLCPAYEGIGTDWQLGSLEIYQERRACEIGTRLLHELRNALPAPDNAAPVAFGGTLSADPYTIASAMAEMTLRELGWNANSFGPNLPSETLCSAIERESPRLIWIGVSHIPSTEQFLSAYRAVFEAAERHGSAVVVGGRALDPSLESRIRFTACCRTMRQLADFAHALYTRKANTG